MLDSYEAAARFAQNWGLIYFFLIFVAIVLLIMRPSQKRRYEEIARQPIREDD